MSAIVLVPRLITLLKSLLLGKVADRIRDQVDEYHQAFPTVLEIPSKEHAYDPEKVCVYYHIRTIWMFIYELHFILKLQIGFGNEENH